MDFVWGKILINLFHNTMAVQHDMSIFIWGFIVFRPHNISLLVSTVDAIRNRAIYAVYL